MGLKGHRWLGPCLRTASFCIQKSRYRPLQWQILIQLNGRGKFRHPAILAGVGAIFFHEKSRSYLATQPNSAGLRMKDEIPKSAVAWICVAVPLLV
jgi:hypothetical protein